MAAPVDTRLGPGTLLLGGAEQGAQISNVTLAPAQKSADGTPTLADPDPLPEVTESWVLSGEAVQDFEEPLGFVNYCMDNALTVKPFVWTPNTDAGVEFSGDVLVTSVPIGGDVSKQNTSKFEFAVQGTPVRDDGGALPDGVTSREVAVARARRRSSAAPAGVHVTRRKKTAKVET